MDWFYREHGMYDGEDVERGLPINEKTNRHLIRIIWSHFDG